MNNLEWLGFFQNDSGWIYLTIWVLALLTIGFVGVPFIFWAALLLIGLAGFGAPLGLIIGCAVVFAIFAIKPIRAQMVSRIVVSLFKKLNLLPKISDTERTALEAGKVWIEKDLFSGSPNFKKIISETKYPKLNAEEQSFMDNQVETLCSMVDDWEYWENRDLPQNVWDYVKKEKFLGMIIPKEFGGLGFSALAHSEAIAKISTRSIPLGVNIMVPNSLGPAELLNHYGTEQQKNQYLPKLATGEEIPCFALTEPTAGSDAGSLASFGVLFKGSDGKLYIKLNWNKRWITLAAVSTLLGLAFRLRDPENLLGKGEDVGITCALIPTNIPGVIIGRRHDPLNCPFYNCPTQGKDVVISVDQVIGGVGGVGQGWTMLMESLAAGRGISLPSQSAGGAKYAALVTSAHATVRKQFGISIGTFEGVEEPMARIAGLSYLMEACRIYTAGAVDEGLKPPVVTAIAKLTSTELMRKVVNDAMDVLGGAGISRGPRNTMAHAYTSLPISITVEGANIMTRTLIIFGQGALRAHPFAYAEVKAVENNDLAGFDRAFWGHIGHVVKNTFRSVLLSLTRGLLASSPVSGEVAQYYRKLSWASASFAIMADIAMGTLAGNLKSKQKITGRFADILSWLYLSTAVLKRFDAEGSRKEDLPLVHFALQHGLSEIQKGFDGLFSNMTIPGFGWVFSILRAWGNFNSFSGAPSDKITHEVSHLIQQDTPQRDRLTVGTYIPKDLNQAVSRINNAFKLVKAAEGVESKIRMAVKAKKIERVKGPKLYANALAAQVITSAEFDLLQKAEHARYDAIQVDDFGPEEYYGKDRLHGPLNELARPVTSHHSSVAEPIPQFSGPLSVKAASAPMQGK